MVDSEALMNGLLQLGMSERESKVFLALFANRGASLADLQRLSGLRPNKVSEIVGSLVRQGYCKERKVGKRRYFDVFDPRVSFNTPLNKLQEQIDKGQELAAELGRLFSEGGKVKKTLDYFVDILHGNDNIHHNYCKLIENAKEEILAIVRPPYACDAPEKVEEQLRIYDDFIARGGVLRWVFEIGTPGQADATNAMIEPLIDREIDVRVSEKLPMKMMIFDRREVLVMQEESISLSAELTMARMRHNTIAAAFRTLFMYFLNQATAYETWKAERSGQSADQSPIVRAKGAGRKQAAHQRNAGL